MGQHELLRLLAFDLRKTQISSYKNMYIFFFSKLLNLLLSKPPDAPQTDGDTDVCL